MKPHTFNHYVIIKLIGKGSYGNVYKVKQKGFHEVYAMKKISVLSNDATTHRNLMTEIKILKCTDCPYIVRLHDMIMMRHDVCLITFYANEGDLHAKIKRLKQTQSFFEEDIVWNYFIQMSLGIRYLHENNIIHRDIKSQNIFIHREADDTRVIKIGDFGVSKILRLNGHKSNTIIGTPLYMSPELIRRESYDKKVDIWALGCILFEMVELIPPFRANTFERLSKKIKTGKYRSSRRHLKTEIHALIQKLIEIDVEDRYSIDDILEHEDVQARMELVPYGSGEYPLHRDVYQQVKIPKNVYDWIQFSESAFDLKTIVKNKRIPKNLKPIVKATKPKSLLPSHSPSKKQIQKNRSPPNKPFQDRASLAQKVKKKYTQDYYRQFIKQKSPKNSYLERLNQQKRRAYGNVMKRYQPSRERLLIKIGSKHERHY